MADSVVAPRSPGTRVARLTGSIVRWVVLLAVATVILIPVAYAVLGGFRNAAQLGAQGAPRGRSSGGGSHKNQHARSM